MKKFLVVLLSLGLIVGFAATASAATTINFAAEYYVWGVYHHNAGVAADDVRAALSYMQTQIRARQEFKIADGLTFTTRFDALEKLWGNTNWKGKTSEGTSSRPVLPVTTNKAGGAVPGAGVLGTSVPTEPKIQESFEFELGWVTFNTAIGTFNVGYQTGQGGFGTEFLNGPQTNPRITLTNKMGPLTLLVGYDKMYDPTLTNDTRYLGKVDVDNDQYTISGIYKDGPMEAGLQYRYHLYNSGRYAGVGEKYSIINPYVRATFGPVFVEGEFAYQFGKKQVAEPPVTTTDIDYASMAGMLRATMTFGPAKIGGLFAYTSGVKDFNVTDKTEYALGGSSFKPTMILLNNDINGMEGDTTVTNQGDNSKNNEPSKNWRNTILYGIFGSYRVTPKLQLDAAFNYATLAQKAYNKTTEYVSDKLGMEFDVYGTYKLYDNLSYMVGGGYLWTGDAFKGNSATAVVGNDYMLMNKLFLSF